MKALLTIFLLLPLAVVAADTNGLPALVPAYGELKPTFWEQHGIVTLVVVPFFSALGVTILLWLLKPKPQPALSPEQTARLALTRLQNEPEDGHVLSAVSQILRHYVSRRFNLTTGELTTAEFISALATTDKVDVQLGESISSFLRECDVRKFSPKNAAAPLNAVNRALEFIAEAEPIATPQPVT